MATVRSPVLTALGLGGAVVLLAACGSSPSTGRHPRTTDAERDPERERARQRLDDGHAEHRTHTDGDAGEGAPGSQG